MIRQSLFDFFKLNQRVVSAKDGILTLEGRQVADFLCQYGASPFGGVDQRLAASVSRFFSQDTAVLCQPLEAEHATRLKQKLVQLCGFEGGSALLTQSGAETVELAVKLARAATGKSFTIALGGAFHGKTTGAVQLTANDDYSTYFGVKNSFVRRLDVGSIADLDKAFADLTSDGQVNGVIAEVVQGEGGMVALSPEWLRHLEALCRAAGILFIVDEIQTGLGRTGDMLASAHVGLTPDVVLLSKALGGGIVPIGACVMRAGLMPPDFTVFHSSTFANNNFTAFVACETLELLEAALPTAREAGAYLEQRLEDLVRRHDDVFERHSGMGLMRGLHLRQTHDDESLLATFQWHSGLWSYAIAAWLLREQSILSMPCFSKPSCLRLQPPLTATKAHIDRAIQAMEALAGLLRSPQVDLALMGAGTMPAQPRDRQPPRAVPKRKSAQPRRRIQFNMHPLHERSFLNSLPESVESLAASGQRDYIERIDELNQIFSGFGAECYDIQPISLGGREVEGRLFGVNLTAEQMIALPPRERQKIQRMMVKSATDYGADVMGLGAFTSIIAHPGLRRLESSAVVTAGSSLTAYAAVQAALSEPPLIGAQHFGIVGAGGSVGGLATQMLILAAARNRHVNQLTLFYNPENPNARRNMAKSLLRSLSTWPDLLTSSAVDAAAASALAGIARVFSEHDMKPGPQQLDATPDMLALAIQKVLGRPLLALTPSDDVAALQGVDRLLLATNSTTELDVLTRCRSGAILYDIGMPASVSPAMLRGGAVQAVTAGIVRAPEDWTFGRGNIAELPPGIMLGCFSETLTLAATDPSAAPAAISISLAEAERIGALARSIGLEPTTCSTLTNNLASAAGQR